MVRRHERKRAVRACIDRVRPQIGDKVAVCGVARSRGRGVKRQGAVNLVQGSVEVARDDDSSPEGSHRGATSDDVSSYRCGERGVVGRDVDAESVERRARRQHNAALLHVSGQRRWRGHGCCVVVKVWVYEQRDAGRRRVGTPWATPRASASVGQRGEEWCVATRAHAAGQPVAHPTLVVLRRRDVCLLQHDKVGLMLREQGGQLELVLATKVTEVEAYDTEARVGVVRREGKFGASARTHVCLDGGAHAAIPGCFVDVAAIPGQPRGGTAGGVVVFRARSSGEAAQGA